MCLHFRLLQHLIQFTFSKQIFRKLLFWIYRCIKNLCQGRMPHITVNQNYFLSSSCKIQGNISCHCTLAIIFFNTSNH